MNVISKAVASISPGADDATSEFGTFDVILSAQSEDRDGETLRSDEWKTPLPDHITFDIDHAMTVKDTIGSGHPFINDNGDLQVKGTYSSDPDAQRVRTKVNEKHIRTTSVTFMTTKSAKSNGGKVERELLNGSFVPIPSNRDTIVLSSKALDVIEKAGARNNASDKKQIQTIHDAAAGLGAACSTADAENADTGEQDGANKSAGVIEVLVRPKLDEEAFSKAVAEAVANAQAQIATAPPPVPAEKTFEDLARKRQSLTYVSKALANSVEDLQGRISDALSDIYERSNPDNWVWLQATFLDDGGKTGTVVYSFNGDSLSRPFSDDGNQVTLGDKVTDVTIITSVVPEGDGSGDGEKSADAAAVEVKAVDDGGWDGSPSRFTIEQYRASCLIGPATASDSKDDYKLPVKEPNGDVNSNAVHAAAAALAGGRGGVDASDDEKKAAAKKLIALYGQLKEDPPDSLLELAGEKPKDEAKSADPVAADVKSAAAGSADEDLALRARALLLINEQRALSL